MQEPEIDTFAEVRNSLYDAIFDRTHRTDIRLPPQALISNLSTVSALYFYTNPPPMAYGTQAPYVAETVDRTRKFNLKRTNKTIQIDKYTIDHSVWEDDFEDFPFKEIHSNWHPYFVHKMCKKYLVDNFMAISRTAKSVMEDSFGTNSDELTKGKQTWDPLTGKSVPSARAYITFSQWILKNCSKKKHTMVEMIQFFMTIMNKSSIKSSIPAFVTIESKRRRNRVLLYNFKKKKVTRKITVHKNKKGHKDGEPSQEYVMHRQEILNLSLCAINMSPKKTFYFSGYYGEYTSWYQDGKIVSQYGPETATLRPGGNNPPDDFYNVAKVTAVSLMKTEINPIGAEAKLRLGISNVRALYHIKKRTQEQAPMLIRNEIRVLADGGLNPWNCSNCHLEETSLKKGWAQSPAEYNYLLKIRNPDNPFVNDPKENVTWSKELSTLTIDQMTNPKTVFSLTKRANRAIKNVTGETHAKEEKAYSEALQIMNTADISLLLTTPKDSLPMAQHLRSCIAALVPGLTLSDDEERQVKKALRRLKTKELEEQGNDDDDNQVVDYI